MQAIIFGTLDRTLIQGEMVIDTLGKIVRMNDNAVVGAFTGVSIFPTAIDSFELGPPVIVVAHMEIPGSFVAKVDVSSLRLQGVAAISAGAVEDYDGDGDPDRAMMFAGSELVKKLKTGTTLVTLVGKMQDGTPIRGTQLITVK